MADPVLKFPPEQKGTPPASPREQDRRSSLAAA